MKVIGLCDGVEGNLMYIFPRKKNLIYSVVVCGQGQGLAQTPVRAMRAPTCGTTQLYAMMDEHGTAPATVHINSYFAILWRLHPQHHGITAEDIKFLVRPIAFSANINLWLPCRRFQLGSTAAFAANLLSWHGFVENVIDEPNDGVGY